MPLSSAGLRLSVVSFALGAGAGVLLTFGFRATGGVIRPSPAEPTPAFRPQAEGLAAKGELPLSEAETLARLNSSTRQLGAVHEWVRDDPSKGTNLKEKDSLRILGFYVFGDTLEIELASRTDIDQRTPSGDVTVDAFRVGRIRIPLNGAFTHLDLKTVKFSQSGEALNPDTPDAKVFCTTATLSLGSEQKNFQWEQKTLAGIPDAAFATYVSNSADNAGGKKPHQIMFPPGFSRQIQWLRVRTDHDFVSLDRIDLISTDSTNKALALGCARAIAHLISLHGGKLATDVDSAAVDYPPLAANSRAPQDFFDSSDSDDPGSSTVYTKVQSVISVNDDGATSLAYLSTWKSQRVVVIDGLSSSKFGPGDWIPVSVIRTSHPDLLSFGLGYGSPIEPIP
jgi:hypothetical protein